MPHFIAWCGFFGAWLLVAGPLDQAVREVEDEEFEHGKLIEAKSRVEEPPPVSAWWLLLPPVWWWLRQRRGSLYQEKVAEAMDDSDLLALLTVKEILNAWFFVAGGAFLIAIKETWELHESYEWPEWVFWAVVVVMLIVCVFSTRGRVLRRHSQPAVDD
jgi:hypothetical protein